MPGTIEKATFDKKHLGFINRVITRGVKKVTPEQVKQLKKHIKDSERLEKTLKKAIAGFDNVQKEMKKIRRSQAFKRISVMTKKGYDNLRKEAEAIETLEKAHQERKEHLEYISQTRGEARDFVREWERTTK